MKCVARYPSMTGICTSMRIMSGRGCVDVDGEWVSWEVGEERGEGNAARR